MSVHCAHRCLHAGTWRVLHRSVLVVKGEHGARWSRYITTKGGVHWASTGGAGMAAKFGAASLVAALLAIYVAGTYAVGMWPLPSENNMRTPCAACCAPATAHSMFTMQGSNRANAKDLFTVGGSGDPGNTVLKRLESGGWHLRPGSKGAGETPQFAKDRRRHPLSDARQMKCRSPCCHATRSAWNRETAQLGLWWLLNGHAIGTTKQHGLIA